MYGNDHDHRGQYADDRHDHDYAEKYHRHHDLEREIEQLRHDLNALYSRFNSGMHNE